MPDNRSPLGMEEAYAEGTETADEDQREIDPKLVPYLDNEFVQDIHGNRIFYKKDFYVAMYKQIHDNNKSYVEAYEALGFDVKVLGKTRAEQAGKNAMEKAEHNRLFTLDPGSYDGSTPLKDIVNLTMEEQNAYMIKRIIYLETMVEAQKKIQFILAESFTR